MDICPFELQLLKTTNKQFTISYNHHSYQVMVNLYGVTMIEDNIKDEIIKEFTDKGIPFTAVELQQADYDAILDYGWLLQNKSMCGAIRCDKRNRYEDNLFIKTSTVKQLFEDQSGNLYARTRNSDYLLKF